MGTSVDNGGLASFVSESSPKQCVIADGINTLAVGNKSFASMFKVNAPKKTI